MQLIIKHMYFGVLKNVIGIDSIPYSTTDTDIPPNSTGVSNHWIGMWTGMWTGMNGIAK